jgi:CelD/BcsL family acetyltransferase involved in cellulose biosynthesis
MVMDTRLVRVTDISTRDEQAWRELATRALEPNPFAEPDFLVPCARHFPSYADTTLVVAEEGGAFRAVVPVVSFEKPRVPPRTLASTAGRPRAGRLLDTPLVDSSHTDEAVGALLDGLHGAAKEEHWPGIVAMDMAGIDGPVGASLHRMCAARGFPVFTKDPWERAIVSRAGRWANPLDGDRRREIGRRTRLLAKETGEEVSLVDRTSDPAVLDDFLKMEMAGWKGGHGGRAFGSSQETTAWFGDWHRQWVHAGRLTVLTINVGRTPVAIQYFVRAGEGLFCFRIAYDEAFSKYKPGAMLLSMALNHLRDNTDAAWLDSTSDKSNKFFLGMLPERRTLARLLIGTGGALDRSLVAALPVMASTLASGRGMRHRWAHRAAQRAS